MIYWILGSVYAFGFLVSVLYAGYENNDDLIPLGLAWPLLVAIAVIVGPFAGLFHLGQELKKRKNTKEELAKNPRKQFDNDLNKLIQEKK